MFVQTTAKVLRRDLLQIVRIICKKDRKWGQDPMQRIDRLLYSMFLLRIQ
jgi:ribosomal protein L36